MHVNRRTFLRAAAGAAATCIVPFAQAFAARERLYVSACTAGDGRHGFAGFTPDGDRAFEVPLPQRGHGSARRPGTGEVVAFARRPGTFMTVVDVHAGRVVHAIDAAPGRHYYGHGVFSPEGGVLYATENAYDDETGVLGVYDARNGYRRVGELPAHGVGPHEIALMPDGETLVVANGAILTHPDTGRVMLNIATMEPSLAYIDRRSGALLEAQTPPPEWHQNSIRHLAVAPDGRVVAGLQYQGGKQDRPPLVMIHRRGERAAFLSAPEAVQTQMRNYCGSVCVDGSGRLAAVSSPRGNLVTLWSLDGHEFAGSFEVPDVCGIAQDEPDGAFVVTSGAGGGYATAHGRPHALESAFLQSLKWDNHLVRL